ncbi:MAG: PaaI family thioesterase [Thermoleophilaceae bacterium]
MSLAERLEELFPERLPGLFGIELMEVSHGSVDGRMALRPEFMAPNDYLHAGAVVSFADSLCGMGCIASLPDGAAGLTTVDLNTNFVRSARAGDAHLGEARMAHGGRTTQVWDATLRRESDGKDLALFRCTQYLLPADDARTRGPRG